MGLKFTGLQESYSQVCNRRGCGIVGQLEKKSKTNSQGSWNSRGLEKSLKFNGQGEAGGRGVGISFFCTVRYK